MTSSGDDLRTDNEVGIVSMEFRSYKAFKHYSIAVQRMNILVGPNNCGKSTIVGAFRLLASSLRKARGRQPQYLVGPNGMRYYGYSLAQENLPVSIENVHTDYADTDTQIVFRLSNSNLLRLYFPKQGGISLLLDPAGKDVRTTGAFRTAYPITIAVVPVLGPVEHEEDFVQEETVQRGLETHRASRHFRSYWMYNLEDFNEFAELVVKTWPAMQIQRPEHVPDSTKLRMFCLENRITRELYWSGFGFQVWCQLLAHISRASANTILIVDEPEIYLHPDVQRQLLGILREIGPDVLLATHSTEIMSEADPAEIVLIDKAARSAERLRDVAGVQVALNKVGSIQNVTLSRLARNRRVLFVEGEQDFVLLRRFARQVGLNRLSTGVDITATQSEGFARWKTVSDFAWGIKKLLTTTLAIGAVFDRDYWCDEELNDIVAKLSKSLERVHIHRRKEIENYLLEPLPLARAIRSAIAERSKVVEEKKVSDPAIREMLRRVTEPFRSAALSQSLARKIDYFRRIGSKVDAATVTESTVRDFETKWAVLEQRLEIVSGKDALKALRDELQEKFGVSLTTFRIIGAFHRDEVPEDLRTLLGELDEFRSANN